MTRYRAKPIRFWLANLIVAPMGAAIAGLVVMWTIFQLVPAAAVDSFLQFEGISLVILAGGAVYGYVFGFFVTLGYAMALALWQHWRRGHTMLEAAIIGWLSLGATWLYFNSRAPSPLLDSYLWGGLIALPLVWFVCLWSGITYRLPDEQKVPA